MSESTKSFFLPLKDNAKKKWWEWEEITGLWAFFTSNIDSLNNPLKNCGISAWFCINTVNIHKAMLRIQGLLFYSETNLKFIITWIRIQNCKEKGKRSSLRTKQLSYAFFSKWKNEWEDMCPLQGSECSKSLEHSSGVSAKCRKLIPLCIPITELNSD